MPGGGWFPRAEIPGPGFYADVLLSCFEKDVGLNTLRDKIIQELTMKSNQELMGKTITGIVAVTPPGERVREIWMLQFSDGSHVEFVSPQAKRRLRGNFMRKKASISRPKNELQLALNVA